MSSGKAYKYVLQFNDYNQAFRALRKLRKRGVSLQAVVIVAEADHWNKIKDLLNNGSGDMIVILGRL